LTDEGVGVFANRIKILTIQNMAAIIDTPLAYPYTKLTTVFGQTTEVV
jgi:predicted glycosyltransferase involved in capsule biosynthesis